MGSTLSASILRNYLPEFSTPHSTPFTRVSTENDLLGAVDTIAQPFPILRADRPALLVSSTSWTPDEDFAVLLKALTIYDTKAKVAGGKLPKVLTIVTGKGPDKEKYMEQVQKLQGDDDLEIPTWTHVRLISHWLEASDYPLLLGGSYNFTECHAKSDDLSYRFSRLRYLTALQLFWHRPPHESRRYVRMRLACVCAQFRLVRFAKTRIF